MRLYFRIAVPLLTWLLLGATSKTTTADDIIPAAAIYAFASMIAYEVLGVVYAYFHKRESESSVFTRKQNSVFEWICEHYMGVWTLCYLLVPAVVIASMWAFGLSFHTMDDRPWGVLPALAMLFVGCVCFSVLDVFSCTCTMDYGDPHSPWSKPL